MHPLRERIQVPPDLESHELYIPEWGQSVWIRGMTALEREQWENSLKGIRGKGAVRAHTAVQVCRDENGALIFEKSDVPALNQQAAASLGRIFDLVIKLTQVSDEDVDTLEGN